MAVTDNFKQAVINKEIRRVRIMMKDSLLVDPSFTDLSVMKKIAIIMIKFYRLFISPLKPPTCRFVPTCSEYALQAIEKYGYPVISKEQARYIEEYRNTKSEKLRDKRLNGNKNGGGKISKKWRYLIDAPFKISAKCCDILKKKPAAKFEKETGLHPIIGNLASESAKRMQDYLKFGCNAFGAKRPISRPLGFWTDEDIWNYIRQYKIPYSKIYDMGYDRTGCMFCMFGVHLEKEPNRFQRMKETHPQLYNYCMNKLGLKEVLDYIGVKY